MRSTYGVLATIFATLAVSQTTSDSFNDIPAPTNVGCGGTVELDSTTIIGSCSGSMTSKTTSAAVQQSGNGGIVDGSTTIGGNANPTSDMQSSTSAGGAPCVTGWNAAAVALGGAGAMLLV